MDKEESHAIEVKTSKKVTTEATRAFYLPSLGKSVQAKNRDDALKKVKEIKK